MAGTVLGKRCRKDALEANAAQRSKKRVQIFHDNENEDDTTHDPLQCDDGDPMLTDELENLSSPKRKVALSSAEPEKRIPLSPTKTNAYSKSRASISSVEHEEHTITQTPTPRTPRHRDALARENPITPKHRVTVSGKPLTPKTPRTPITPSSLLKTIYADARKVFTRGSCSSTLVGRQNERDELYSFISCRVSNVRGGCLYVSGPPGTGKSAFVSEICHSFHENEPVKFAYINCMSIKSAANIYLTLASELGISEDGNAEKMLKTLFSRGREGTSYLVVLDEIDQLLNLDLDVLYSLFEWSFQKKSSLILVGISNALDLTDRFLPRLKAKNLKPQLLPFLPYSAQEISTVISSRARSLLSDDTSTGPDFVPFLHPNAIQLISKKVAAQTGDLRKAFDLASRAVELIESETKEKFIKECASTTTQTSPSRTPLAENNNLSSPSPSSSSTPTAPQSQTTAVQKRLAQLSPETAPRASIAHVVRMTSSVFGNGTAQRLKTLNLQQKVVLCCLVALEDRRKKKKKKFEPSGTATPTAKRNKKITAAGVEASPSKTNQQDAPTLRDLFEVYSTLCGRDNVLHVLSRTEFRDVVGNLETLSLVQAACGSDGKKNGSSFFGSSVPGTPSKRGKSQVAMDDKRVAACVGVQELEDVVKGGVGDEIMKNILHGEGIDEL